MIDVNSFAWWVLIIFTYALHFIYYPIKWEDIEERGIFNYLPFIMAVWCVYLTVQSTRLAASPTAGNPASDQEIWAIVLQDLNKETTGRLEGYDEWYSNREICEKRAIRLNYDLERKGNLKMAICIPNEEAFYMGLTNDSL